MSNREHARMLLRKAEEDLRALENMGDPESFSAGIFGFHAQQAAEKCLKAWIANFGLKYPLTHNLRFLLDLLVKNGHETRDFESVAELSAFAIQFRYGDDHRAPVSVDRPGVLKSVRLLHEAVARIVG